MLLFPTTVRRGLTRTHAALHRARVTPAEALAFATAAALAIKQGQTAAGPRILVVKVSARLAFDVTTLCTVAQLQITRPYPAGTLIEWTTPRESLLLSADGANTYSVHEPFTGLTVVTPPNARGAARLILTLL